MLCVVVFVVCFLLAAKIVAVLPWSPLEVQRKVAFFELLISLKTHSCGPALRIMPMYSKTAAIASSLRGQPSSVNTILQEMVL